MGFNYLESQPELGKNARKLRVESGITQEQIAVAVGCTRQAIINFESGLSQSMPILQAYIALNELRG